MSDRGLTQKVVQIEEISDGFAHCVDRFGRIERIPTTVQRAKGSVPRAGEQWVIDKAVGGRWSFAAVISPQPVVVTGARDDGTALTALLSALEAAGLIVDDTTPT